MAPNDGAKSASPFRITSKRERTLFGAALSEAARPRPDGLLSRIEFLFAEIKRSEDAVSNAYETARTRLKSASNGTDDDALSDLIAADKKFGGIFLKEFAGRSVTYQCIIIQTAKWMKSVIKSSYDSICSTFDRKANAEKWQDALLQSGPMYRREYWANGMIIASNYVRHFDEWQYDKFERYGPNEELRIRRERFVASLEGKQAKRNCQVLIELGVSERELFGLAGAGETSIMLALDSTSSETLRANCEAWLEDVNRLTRMVTTELLEDHPESIEELED